MFTVLVYVYTYNVLPLLLIISVAEIDATLQDDELDELDCTDDKDVCTNQLQLKLTDAGEKWLLTFFAEQCNHNRDYLRLLYIFFAPIVICYPFTFIDKNEYIVKYSIHACFTGLSQICNKKDFILFFLVALFVLPSPFIHFVIYSRNFYYPLTESPCSCFKPAFTFMGLSLFFSVILIFILCVVVLYSSDSSRFVKVCLCLCYFLYFWILNDYFC